MRRAYLKAVHAKKTLRVSELIIEVTDKIRGIPSVVELSISF